MKPYKQSLLTVAALAAIPSSAISATIIDVDFEGGLGNLKSGGSNAQSDSAGVGTGDPASRGLNSGNHGALIQTTTRAIDSVMSFSVDAKWVAPTHSGRQGLLVGWTKDTGAFNSYEGANVTAVGLENVGAVNEARFVWGNGTNDNRGTAFDTSPAATVAMVVGNWYRFSGTINYDGTAGAFTFTDLVLANIGTDGTGTANPILSGSFTDGYSYSQSSGWLTAVTSNSAVTVISGSQGGISNIDNFSVTAIPEPSTTALLGLGGLALILRRRK